MTDDREMTSQEKLMYISQQIDTMDRVGLIDFHCPYCKRTTSPGKEFCCPTAGHAIQVLCDARDRMNEALQEHRTIN
jgi:hypothetical protein